MASRTALLITAAMAVAVVGALLPATVSHTAYRVGDDAGWTLGVDYYSWLNGRAFYVGDMLEFVYSTKDPAHSVVVVDEASFVACSAPSGLGALTLTSGDDRVVLGAPGQFLFICGVEGHCLSGMKLIVNVRG